MNSAWLVAGRYAVDDPEGSLIGQGGMGAVFLGRDKSLEKPVALKRLRSELVAPDPEMVERFAREGEALRQLNHPNIVKVLAAVEEDGQHYIVMDSALDEADVLAGLAQIAAARGFLLEAADRHKRSLVLYKQEHEQGGVASGVVQLGRIANERGRYDEARVLLTDALTLRRELGDLPGVAGVLDTLGFNAYRLGDADSALLLADESQLIYESIDNRAGVANAIRLKGMVASLSGAYDKAKEYYRQALEIRREIGNRGAVAGSYTQLSHLALITGDYEAAKEYALRCLAIGEEINNRWAQIYALSNLGLAQVHLREKVAGRESLLKALRIARDMDAEPLALEILVGFAELAASSGDFDRALRILCVVRGHSALIRETWDMAAGLFERVRQNSHENINGQPCQGIDSDQLEDIVNRLIARP